jgi:spore germination cell wall hydrolase CwlJ-like protein
MIRSAFFIVLFLAYLVIQQISETKQKFPRVMVSNPKPTAVFDEVKPLKLSRQEIECLSRNVFYEAGTENPVGKIAVAQVTLNRVKTGYWGRKICDVVYAPEQFSWTKDEERLYAKPNGKLWHETQIAVSTFLENGVRIKQLNRALFYHAEYVTPNWRDNNKRIGQIGTHVFYTGGKDSWLEL